MDYIHTWLNKWRMQGNFTKQVMVFHWEVNLAAAGEDRRNTWTLGGIAIDQVSKYKDLGVVYQETDHGGTRARLKMQAYGYC
jgi:hypothetical protein